MGNELDEVRVGVRLRIRIGWGGGGGGENRVGCWVLGVGVEDRSWVRVRYRARRNAGTATWPQALGGQLKEDGLRWGAGALFLGS